MAAQCILTAAYFLRVSICAGNFYAFTGNSMGKALPSAQFGSFSSPSFAIFGRYKNLGLPSSFYGFQPSSCKYAQAYRRLYRQIFPHLLRAQCRKNPTKELLPLPCSFPLQQSLQCLLATAPNRSEASAYISGGAMLSLCVRLAITPQIEAALSPKACATTNSAAVSIS